MSANDTCRIIIDDSRLMLQIVASLTDDSRGVIYNHNMFIVQATAYLSVTILIKTLMLITCAING
jgi:hypothetical protein